jgi:hypothetical protein
MPRFFFHLRDRQHILRDEEGKQCRDMAEAAQFALKAARALISSDALDGRIDLDGQIDIADEGGRLLSTLLFRDAVIVRP